MTKARPSLAWPILIGLVLVIARWEGMYDAEKGERYLASLPSLGAAVQPKGRAVID